MKKIDIATALDKLNITSNEDGSIRTYGFQYVKANGERGMIYNARKNVKSPRAEGEQSSRGKASFNLKQHGVVRLHNQDTDQVRDIKKAHMTHFRDYNTDIWLEIFH